MPLPVVDHTAMERHLEALGVLPGMSVIVHSRLISFGIVEGGAATVFRALRRLLGVNGTIVVPTFTLRLSAADCYDRSTTPSQKMGSFSEFVRNSDGSVRSRCPMHNHAGVGRDANILEIPDGSSSLGRGSDFDVLASAGYLLLLLGCRFSEGATYLHQVEAVAGVPYRKWLDLPRIVKADDGTVKPMVCRYYGLMNKEFDVNFDIVPPIMRRSGTMRFQRCAFAESTLVALTDLHNCAAAMLLRDSYALVKPAND